MRIGILAAGELFGGVERHIVGIATELRARGALVHLFLFHDGELAVQARMAGIDPVLLPDRNAALLSTARHLSKLLDTNDIRILHVHGYKATVFAAAAHRRRRSTMFKTEHGLPELWGALSQHAWRSRLYFIAEAVATRLTSDTVFYVSEDLRRRYRTVHAGMRSEVIPNGICESDASQFPRPLELRPDGFNLLIAGRVDVVKGHHILVKALSARWLPENIRLYVLGDGPCAKDVLDMAQANGVADRVHLLGFRRNAYDYIAHCDVLIMPSLHEGLPYALLEAMSLGKPIIASRVGGLAETLQHNVTALLVPSQDPEALALAISRLHDDAPLRSMLGQEAQRVQRQRYSIDKMTDSYVAHYLRARLVHSTESFARR